MGNRHPRLKGHKHIAFAGQYHIHVHPPQGLRHRLGKAEHKLLFVHLFALCPRINAPVPRVQHHHKTVCTLARWLGRAQECGGPVGIDRRTRSLGKLLCTDRLERYFKGCVPRVEVHRHPDLARQHRLRHIRHQTRPTGLERPEPHHCKASAFTNQVRRP